MRIPSCIGIAALILLSACQSTPQLSAKSTLGRASSSEPAVDRIRDANTEFQSGLPARHVVFRQSDGTPEFSLQFKPTGGKLIDRKGNVITNFILKGDNTIQLTDTRNKTVGYVARTQNTWQIENPKRSKALFTFRREADGSAALLRNGRNEAVSMYEIQVTEGGYTVASGKSDQYIISSTKGQKQIQTNEGETVIITDGAIEPVALASFGFTKLTQAQQAGLAYALSANVL